KAALASLDPRSRRIVEARWLREKNAATLHDLAAEFKVSAERIRQIEAKALEKMKKVMQFGAGGAATPLAPPRTPQASPAGREALASVL
ncbi:MAG TPA: sigma factor-like helix-turn-helix DNA-binding protein, partial [Burkholderiales bacterium]